MVWSRIKSKQQELEQLCLQHRVRRLALFGSTAGPDFELGRSDLDFLVEFDAMPPAEYAEAYFCLWEGLEKLFGQDVDLVTEPSVTNPYFRQGIEKHRVELYVQWPEEVPSRCPASRSAHCRIYRS